MDFFLPIAGVSIDLPVIFFLSFAVGILSGLFGVGGGFLMTPFLIFLGIPPVYAVPNEANNILGTSISGSTTHYLKGTLDYKMGLMIVIGGAAGTVIGIYTFSYFQNIGYLNNKVDFKININELNTNYADVDYLVTTGPQYYIGEVNTFIDSNALDSIYNKKIETC